MHEGVLLRLISFVKETGPVVLYKRECSYIKKCDPASTIFFEKGILRIMQACLTKR